MEIPFTIQEFCITPDDIPQEVADKIWRFHIMPMLPVRALLGAPIWPSQNSGFRPYDYEIRRGRSGRSQHVFGQNEKSRIAREKAQGAVDWTASDLDELERLIIEHTDYTRIARYEGFIHCDYAPTKGGRRQYFTSDAASNWEFIKHLD